MTVRVRNTENGVVIGVSEIVAEGLTVSGQFEVVVDEKPPAKKAAAKPSKS